MDPSHFTEKAPGRLVETTDALGSRGYAFIPDPIPPDVDLGSKPLRLALSRAEILDQVTIPVRGTAFYIAAALLHALEAPIDQREARAAS